MEEVLKSYGLPGLILLLACYVARWTATNVATPLTTAIIAFIQATAENNNKLAHANEENAASLRILAQNCPGFHKVQAASESLSKGMSS